MSYLFTSESVSEGHPDKIADQISDALLDAFLSQDPNSKVACETMVTTGLVILAGEVKTNSYVDVQHVARKTIEKIGYTNSELQFDYKSCGVISAIHEQSSDINQGVDREKEEDMGAGDQGMMFGFASSETENYMPLALELAHRILLELAKIRREGKVMNYLRPDAKSQVTIRYSDDHVPEAIETIVVSTQHDEFVKPESDSPEAIKKAEKEMHKRIDQDIREHLIPRVKDSFKKEVQDLFGDNINYFINPTGKFVIGGPHGDTGLTGRKIIVDTYGGRGAHGGGAFSGKDPSKVDRSAAYACRHIAKNLVHAGVCEQALVQVAYAIGEAEPVGLFVDTFGTAKVKGADGNMMRDGKIAEELRKIFPMRPADIIKRLKLKDPIYAETAAYGHMGRLPEKLTKYIEWGRDESGSSNRDVELFTWEKLDFTDEIKKAFGL